MNALEAYRDATGAEPTDTHRLQANEHGGLHDEQTIESTPEQINVFERAFWRRYGVLLANRGHLADVMNLKGWSEAKNGRWREPERWVRYVFNSLMRTGDFDEDTRVVNDPIVGLYFDVLGRAPDQSGLEYWRGRLEDGVPLPEIRAHFEYAAEH